MYWRKKTCIKKLMTVIINKQGVSGAESKLVNSQGHRLVVY